MWEGNLLPFDRFQSKKIITIMWEGNLLPFDRFQDKKKGITIMWEGNLLPFDRFQPKNNYNHVRGQFTTFWQIPVNNNNYNHVRGQFTYLLTDSRQKK